LHVKVSVQSRYGSTAPTHCPLITLSPPRYVFTFTVATKENRVGTTKILRLEHLAFFIALHTPIFYPLAATHHHFFSSSTYTLPLTHTTTNINTMPPKANDAKPGKMFSENVVAALILAKGDTTISKKCYEMMSALDGNKTASGLEHDFRSVIAKVKELKKRVEDGEVFVPVTPASKRGGGGKPSIHVFVPANMARCEHLD
jgi:hypothetical protein